MFRIIIHLTTIACLLACPVRCFAIQAISGGQPVAAVKACGCCPCDANEASTGGVPSNCPDSGCDCANCICEGAVLENGKQPISDVVAYAVLDIQSPQSDQSIRAIAGRSLKAAFMPAIIHPSGRAARIAHCSLLI